MKTAEEIKEAQKRWNKKTLKNREEALIVLSKYKEGTKGMEYHVYNGRNTAKATVDKLKYFFEKYPNLKDEDIWVIQDDLGYMVALNPEKEDEETKKWWIKNKDNVGELTLIDQFKRWGSQGGKKKGQSKVRGDSEYYRNIAKKRKRLTQTS